MTGACMAVEARKFVEVGGFDEVRLPIEYNDIDLCLRLAERGYESVFEPRARLEHRESASRGANPYLDIRYANEHGYFRERWARLLRDDPYFHPRFVAGRFGNRARIARMTSSRPAPRRSPAACDELRECGPLSARHRQRARRAATPIRCAPPPRI